MSSPITRYAVALTTAALLGACSAGSGVGQPAGSSGGAGEVGGSGSRPPATGSASTRPTTSASARPTYPTDLPTAAQADTPAGALAFVRAVFGRLNTAYVTGQSGLVQPLGTARCAGCATLENAVTAVASQGRHTVSEPLLLREVTLSNEPRRAGTTVVDVLFHQRPVGVVDAAGKAAGSVPEVKGIYLVTLVRDAALWRVDAIELLQ